jgi:hypothetical protein
MGEPQSIDAQYRNLVWDNRRWDGFELRDDDIVICTPPKSGTTWMQMQVALLLFRTPDLPAPLAVLSPWLEMNTRPLAEVRADLEAQQHRRFIKTHTALGGLPWRDPVTYLHVCRDPRDAAISWDNHMANLDVGRLFELRAAAVGMDDLEELSTGPLPAPPADPADRFWVWVEGLGGGPSGLESTVRHIQSFWKVRDRPNVHLFRYGDLTEDLAGEMARVADVLGVAPPTDELVDAARFERMKARADDLAPNTDVALWQRNDQFFDKARSGDWRDLVGDGGLARYEAAVRAITDDEELIRWIHCGPIA